VITGGIGICHIYVDASANLEKALPVIYNAKTQRPSVCNALDTLLVHRAIAAEAGGGCRESSPFSIRRESHSKRMNLLFLM